MAPEPSRRISGLARQLTAAAPPPLGHVDPMYTTQERAVRAGLLWTPGHVLRGLTIRQDVRPEDLIFQDVSLYPRPIDPASTFNLRTESVDGLLTDAEFQKLVEIAHARPWGRTVVQDEKGGSAGQAWRVEKATVGGKDPNGSGIGTGIPARHEASAPLEAQQIHGGAFSAVPELAARQNQFRETFWYSEFGEEEDVGFVMNHPRLFEAAKKIFPGRDVVEPYICYGNMTVPGMFLGVHTDCPAFRGLERSNAPQWLLSVMHHSGLFDAHRIPIANAIIYFQDHTGGGLRHFPEGTDGPKHVFPSARNSCIMIDSDSQFHGVEQLEGELKAPHTKIATLRPPKPGEKDDPRWALLGREGEELGRVGWEEMRLSVLWKAYMFKDESERNAWRNHTDDLTVAQVLDTMIADLSRRGRLPGNQAPKDQVELATLLSKEYYHDYPRQEHNLHHEVLRRIQP